MLGFVESGFNAEVGLGNAGVEIDTGLVDDALAVLFGLMPIVVSAVGSAVRCN